MFFNSVDEIQPIASRVGCSVFVLPKLTKFEIKNAIILTPETKSVITIEQVRQVMARLELKQRS